MRYRLLCSGVLAASSLAASTGALAQSQGTVGNPGISPATPPALIAPLPMGNNTSVNQPGVPNTSTAGQIGTNPTPSGLPGESTHHPGFPGRRLQ